MESQELDMNEGLQVANAFQADGRLKKRAETSIAAFRCKRLVSIAARY